MARPARRARQIILEAASVGADQAARRFMDDPTRARHASDLILLADDVDGKAMSLRVRVEITLGDNPLDDDPIANVLADARASARSDMGMLTARREHEVIAELERLTEEHQVKAASGSVFNDFEIAGRMKALRWVLGFDD